MKRDEGGELRPPQWELEESSFDDLAVGLTDVTITRSRAIKLAGAALAGSALTLLWPAEADARRRRKKRRRRRRKAVVNNNPATVSPSGTDGGGTTTISITNPSDTRDLIVSGAQLLDSAGNLVSTGGLIDPLTGATLTDPVTIAPNDTADVGLTFAGPLVGADSLRLFDGSGNPITVLNPDGTVAGDVDVNLDLAAGV